MVDFVEQISGFVPVVGGEYKACGELVLLKFDALVARLMSYVEHNLLALLRLFVETYSNNGKVIVSGCEWLTVFAEMLFHPCGE